MAESRVKKSLLNAKVNLIFYMLTLALSFFSRKIFLNCLGADFVGLIGTMQNLLGFLNLAELGVGAAIGYVLYKPLFEEDHRQINEIISVFGYLYRWIGWIILALGSILACFLPLIFPNTGFELGVIYAAYFAFLSSSLIGYFINYKQTLLGADQKNYVVTAYFQSTNIVKILIQMASAWYTGSYYLWVAIELVFGVICSFILNWRIRVTYPWLKSEVQQGIELFKKYPEVIKYTKQLFVQKASYIVQYQTIPFLIYTFVNLKYVAFYGNYTIITDKLSQFLNTFFESTGASVGNLIAEGNTTKIKKLFWELLSIRYLIGSTITFMVYVMIEPFINLWLGSEYLLPKSILFLICINILIGYTRGSVMQFLFGYGMFSDVWAPVTEIILNLGIAVVAGYFWGLNGILLGSIASQLSIIGIWKPYFLFSKAFRESVWGYWKKLSAYLFSITVTWLVVVELVNPNIPIQPALSLFHWMLYAILEFAAFSFTCFLLMFLLTQGMKDFTFRFIKKRFGEFLLHNK
jgi:O-antigen/teichoic acid export membrane protein